MTATRPWLFPATIAFVAAILLAFGCAGGAASQGGEDADVTPPTTTATSASNVAEDDPGLIPPGYGTLRQDEVTLSLRRDDLLIKVTPLDPAIVRVLATDTWQRLRGLREGHEPQLVRETGISDPELFLVSFFSYEQQVRFEPEDVHLLNRGLRFRPRGIRPVTPGWGRQRLAQEGTQMAVYAFDSGIDLEQDLVAQYQDERAGGWERILQEIQAERARILARARSM